MKIAVISGDTKSILTFRLDMIKTFIQHGCDVVAIGDGAEDVWKETFAGYGIDYYQAVIKRNGLNPFEDFNALKSIKDLLMKIKPDKIFMYQAKAVVYGTLAAHQLGISEIYPMIAGLGSIFIGNNIKSKIVRAILIIEYIFVFRFSKKIFFQNRDDVSFFSKRGLLDSNKVVIVNGSGVRLDYFIPSHLPAKISFLLVARLIKDKGVMEYLQASRVLKQHYPDVSFMLVGPFDTNPSGIKPEEIQTYINDGTIEYYGEQIDVRPFYQKCYAFVLPSYREGTPKSNLEAMACGRAIITTDAPGCRETVIDGKNGILVPIKDVDALVSAMTRLIDNKRLAESMGEASREMAEIQFDVRKVNQKICETMKIC